MSKVAKKCKSAEDFQSLSKLLTTLSRNPGVDVDQIIDILKEAKGSSAVTESIVKLLNTPSMQQLDATSQNVILAQCENYPNAEAIATLTSMTSCDWFVMLSKADMQRASKTMAYMASMVNDSKFDYQKDIINHTLGHILSEKIPMRYVDIDDDPGQVTGGFARPGEAGININRVLVSSGDKSYKKQSIFNIVDVLCHETNHQMNGDVNEASYKYFQAEYRAWLVGNTAKDGSIPNNQAAFERCKEIIELYPYIKEAYFSGNEESKQIASFLCQILGKEYNADSYSDLERLLNKSVSNKKATAPMPDPALNPDNDN